MPRDIQIVGNRFIDILRRFPCPQRILMVTDGSLGFGTNGFGLSEFVQIVRDAGHTVHTAHRSGSGGPSIPGAFNFATAVLTWKKGDSVGDMCQYPDRGWDGYTANLGKPTGKRADRGGLLIRKLQRGIVIVNPGDKAVRAKLPRNGVNLAATVWPTSATLAKAVTLAPRSAAVVLYK